MLNQIWDWGEIFSTHLSDSESKSLGISREWKQNYCKPTIKKLKNSIKNEKFLIRMGIYYREGINVTRTLKLNHNDKSFHINKDG